MTLHFWVIIIIQSFLFPSGRSKGISKKRPPTRERKRRKDHHHYRSSIPGFSSASSTTSAASALSAAAAAWRGASATAYDRITKVGIDEIDEEESEPWFNLRFINQSSISVRNQNHSISFPYTVFCVISSTFSCYFASICPKNFLSF